MTNSEGMNDLRPEKDTPNLKVLVLEDNRFRAKDIADDIRDAQEDGLLTQQLDYEFVKTASEFRQYVGRGRSVDLYFLDDQVPENETTDWAERPLFVQNATYLLEQKPEAKIFYTGSAPERGARSFCEEKGIRLIAKSWVARIIREEISKLIK